MSVATITPTSDRTPARGFAQVLNALSGLSGSASPLMARAVVGPLDPLDYLSRFQDVPMVLWQQGDALHWGLGIAAEIVAQGPERFDSIQAEARRVFDELSAQGSVEPPPFVGGFSFDTTPVQDPAWAAFPAARFILPAVTYSVTPEGCHVTAIVGCRPESFGDDRVRELLSRMGARAIGSPLPPTARVIASSGDRSAQLHQWSDLLAHALRQIDDGTLQKVVVARQCALQLEREPDLGSVLRALRAYGGECTLFALRFGGPVFMGVTPECLVERRGLQVYSGALAGSIDSSEVDAGGHLLSLDKERREHALVLDAIVARLRPFCATLEFPESPEPRVLRHITHLHTPVVGRLHAPRHVLELVRELHPTPAVGGTPRPAALAWIARHEPTCRGWYAGPVGWFDRHGEGRFEVALRSTLLAGRHALAYAGAGIVAGSEPAAEFAETELKLTAVVHALTARSAELCTEDGSSAHP